MKVVLLDLHLAEKKISYANIAADSIQLAFHAHFKKQALEKVNTDVPCFEASINYYMKNPDELELIYKGVVDSLEKLDKYLEENTFTK